MLTATTDERCYLSFVKMIVPDAANMPPTP
jgi:hypothetical protein